MGQKRVIGKLLAGLEGEVHEVDFYECFEPVDEAFGIPPHLPKERKFLLVQVQHSRTFRLQVPDARSIQERNFEKLLACLEGCVHNVISY